MDAAETTVATTKTAAIVAATIISFADAPITTILLLPLLVI